MELTAPIKAILEAAGITATIKRVNMPDTPNDVIVIRDTGEYDPDPYITTIQNRTVQILVRATDYTASLTLCSDIRNALHGSIGTTTGGVHFLNILALSGFQPIGGDGGDYIKDELGRYVYSANFTAKVRAA